MTSFSAANIPSNVNTLEELAGWVASALTEINPVEQITVSAGQLEPVATTQTFRFAGQVESPERLICVLYLPLTGNYRGQGKIWSNGISEISTTALPTGYTQN